MRALPIDVYRWNLSDCTNGGISSKYDRLLLVSDDGYIEIDEQNPPENLVVMVTRNLFGNEFKHIEPYARPLPKYHGWMDGGNIADSCDGRFFDMSHYPLKIYDRQESPELYDKLSR